MLLLSMVSYIQMYRFVGMMNGGLKHKETYYVTVTAVNKIGLRTPAYSKPLTVDNTPPKVRLRDIQLRTQRCNVTTVNSKLEGSLVMQKRSIQSVDIILIKYYSLSGKIELSRIHALS